MSALQQRVAGNGCDWKVGEGTDREFKNRMLTGGHKRSGGSSIFKPKSRFRSDLVSCSTEAGSEKSSCLFGFKLEGDEHT